MPNNQLKCLGCGAGIFDMRARCPNCGKNLDFESIPEEELPKWLQKWTNEWCHKMECQGVDPRQREGFRKEIPWLVQKLAESFHSSEPAKESQPHPEDVKEVEKKILLELDRYLYLKGDICGKQEAAEYLAQWFTGFWSAMDEGAAQWESDCKDAQRQVGKLRELLQALVAVYQGLCYRLPEDVRHKFLKLPSYVEASNMVFDDGEPAPRPEPFGQSQPDAFLEWLEREKKDVLGVCGKCKHLRTDTLSNDEAGAPSVNVRCEIGHWEGIGNPEDMPSDDPWEDCPDRTPPPSPTEQQAREGDGI